jgi:chaperone modulatory protein CbpM
MNSESHEWLDTRARLTLGELSALSGLPETDVQELVDFGALVPADADPAQWIFNADWVVTVRKASRLRRDLELDPGAFALAVRFLRRIDELEARVMQLQARQMGHWRGR